VHDDEIERYFREPVLMRSSDPLEYWRESQLEHLQ